MLIFNLFLTSLTEKSHDTIFITRFMSFTVAVRKLYKVEITRLFMNIYCKNQLMQEKELGVEGDRKKLNFGAPSNAQPHTAINP